MLKPLVSIIIPTYNSEHYIDGLFESIKNVANAELIIIDDGSKDQTVMTIRMKNDQLSNFENVKLISNEHYGPSVSRNIGIQKAKGKYIVFVDSDDLVDSGALNKICSLDLDHDIISFSNNQSMKILKSDDEKFSLISAIVKNSGIDAFTAAPWGKLYKRSFLLSNNLLFSPSLHKGEDLLFNVAAIQRAKSILLSSPSFYHVKLSPNSITRGMDTKALDNSRSFIGISTGVIDNIRITMPSIRTDKIDFLKIYSKNKSFNMDISYALRHNFAVSEILEYTRWFYEIFPKENVKIMQSRGIFKKIELLIVLHEKVKLMRIYIFLVNGIRKFAKIKKAQSNFFQW